LTARAVFFSLWLCLSAAPLSAGQKVYAGDEAVALRCANTLAFTAVALAESGRLGEPEKNVMLQITVLILERHVSGTWAQKKAALRVVRDRRNTFETLDDFERNAQRCFERFPIN
jgi:hypothetical protein